MTNDANRLSLPGAFVVFVFVVKLTGVSSQPIVSRAHKYLYDWANQLAALINIFEAWTNRMAALRNEHEIGTSLVQTEDGSSVVIKLRKYRLGKNTPPYRSPSQ